MYTSPRRKGAPSESRSSLRAYNPRKIQPACAIAAAPAGLASASLTRKNSAPVHRYQVQIYNPFQGVHRILAAKIPAIHFRA